MGTVPPRLVVQYFDYNFMEESLLLNGYQPYNEHEQGVQRDSFDFNHVGKNDGY